MRAPTYDPKTESFFKLTNVLYHLHVLSQADVIDAQISYLTSASHKIVLYG